MFNKKPFMPIFLAIAFFLPACGGSVAATATPTCVPPAKDRQLGFSLSFWSLWDGSERSYLTGGGSVYYFRLENGEVVVDLTPAFNNLPRAEVMRLVLKENFLAVVPLGTNMSDQYYVFNGPIYLFRCGEAVWIDDEYKDREVVIPFDKPIDKPSDPSG